ncbi:MAG: bis(5'-nucleosyl)-tetraphosphatase (symmetrical) YqeK [Cyanobacteria bacterium P01_A01_bin.84]
MRQQVLNWLKDNVPTSRLSHVIRVEQMAVELAICHNLDTHKAASAGLMHDLAKYFGSDKLLEIARANGLKLDEVMKATPHLLHADASAIVAKTTFNVQDEEVLQAIANHTLGRPAMNMLSCIVFLADSLEPGRGDSEELQALRSMSYENLYKAVYLTCDRTLRKLLLSSKLIHPRVIETRNWFLVNS